ncbi:MAG: tetratricopeptide repeat protein, partial [Planctomycetota bacterium]
GEVVHQAQWVGHVSGLSDALPPRMAAALAGMPPPPETLPAEMAARFQQACGDLESGRIDQALAACDAILKAHRRDVPTLLLRGYAGLQKKGWSRYAVKDFEKVLELDPGDVAARLGLARAKLDGDWRSIEQAVGRLREVIETQPEHGEALWLWATALERLARLDEAAAAARRATEALSDFGPAWQTLARVQLVQGKLVEALALATRATECDPADPAAWMLLGDTQAADEAREAAKGSWQRALRCHPPPEMMEKLHARLQQFD